MKIRLMPDYDCYPLWVVTSDGVRNIAPDELPISDTLRQSLLAWAARYDSTLRRDDPASSGFESRQAELEFDNTGRALGASLRAELGTRVEVVYFSQTQHCEVQL